MNRRREQDARRAFTLLEVLLSLLLATLVLMAVAAAIDLHLRVLDVGRTDVEQAQLARALLRHIAADLRGAVLYDPVDVRKLVPQQPSSSATSTTTGNQTSGGSGASGGVGQPQKLSALTAKTAITSSSKDSDTEEDSAEQSSSPSLVKPGLYGSSSEIQIDVSRLPRPDQLLAASAGQVGAVADPPSDVKTVTYFLSTDAGAESLLATGLLAAGTGLVRCERARAVTAWASQQGTLSNLQSGLVPIAPEVLGLEFRYYDGTEWLDEWDSDDKGGLPLAVEVSLAVGRPGAEVAPGWSLSGEADQAIQDQTGAVRIYRMIVHLPAARAKSTATTESTEQTPDETSASSSTNAGTSP